MRASRLGAGGSCHFERPVYLPAVLPDKAIDLVDEAASRLRMEIDSRPVEIDPSRAAGAPAGDRRDVQRRRGVKPERLAKLRSELADQKLAEAHHPAGRTRERPFDRNHRDLKERLEALAGNRKRAERDNDLAQGRQAARAASRVEELDAAFQARRPGAGDAQGEVGPSDIADVVSAWTSIPAGLEGETARLLRMEDGWASGSSGEGRGYRSL